MKAFFHNIYVKLKYSLIVVRLRHLYYRFYNAFFDSNIKFQNKNIKAIPIVIMSYNQLYYLKKLLLFLQNAGHTNIIILDNNSDYKPLLDFFESLSCHIKVIRLTENYGHNVFWNQKALFKDITKGYYVVTDPDIVPVDDCPDDFLSYFKKLLDKDRKLSKVGFSLKIDDIPEENPNKNKIVNWEERFWKVKTKKGDYLASIDTTFALYPPKNIWQFRKNFYHAIRTKPPYSAMHGGWYVDINNLTKEQHYYMKSANTSSSWNVNQTGNLKNKVVY